MLIYLPIADVAVNVWAILFLGGAVGLISGLFGVGGGFLLTPLLIMSGIPPAVAVATQAPQVVAAAVSGALAYGARSLIDFRMGLVLLLSGLLGSRVGVEIFGELQRIGQVEFTVTALYVVLLTSIGGLMAWESYAALRSPRPAGGEIRRAPPKLFRRLPFQMTFRAAGQTYSVIPPICIGFSVGALGAIMGVGGGFIMVPAMIYLLGMTTSMSIGTSLFQIMIVMAGTTLFHATETGSVDAVLAVTLLLGSVVGAQIGALLAHVLRAASLRFLLALLVLGVAVALALNLFLKPSSVFSLSAATSALGGASGAGPWGLIA
ncbi:MAG: sulfite exporter TauE/SafE family protein [Pseudomonadota bacterium]